MTNEELDAKVLSAVRSGKVRMVDMKAALTRELSEFPGREDRALDRSLQRLRRRGRAAYDFRTGWRALP